MNRIGILLMVVLLGLSGIGAEAATISVASGPADAIQTAIAGANAGDVIELTDAGPYAENTLIATANAITVRAAVPATITSTVVGSWFNPQGGGIQFGDNGSSRITLQTSALTFWFDSFALPAGETLTIQNVEFQLSNGGFGVYARNGTSGVNNVAMSNCLWSSGGGTSFDIKCLGDIAAGTTDVVVDGSDFNGNSDVGPEVMVGGSVTLNNCNLRAGNNNLLVAFGGTITVNGGTLTATNSSFYAALALGGDIVINDCTLVNNSGTGYVTSSSTGTVTVNRGTVGDGDWYVSLSSGGITTYNDVTVDGSSNALGIGLYSNGGTLNVNNCFCSNWAQQPIVVLGADSITNVSETLFSNNTNYDIQIAVSGTSVNNISHSVITAPNGISTTIGESIVNIDHCTMLGGLYSVRDIVGGNNVFDVRNCIVASTFGLNDLDVGGGSFTSSYNDVVSPSGYQDVTPGTGDIMVDPMFANPPVEWNGPGQPDLSSGTYPDDLIPQEATVLTGDEFGMVMGAFDAGGPPPTPTPPPVPSSAVNEWELYD